MNLSPTSTLSADRLRRRRSFAAKSRAIVAPVAAVALWEIAVAMRWLPPSLAAAPTQILRRFVALVGQGEILTHLALSLLRIGAAVLLGSGAGVVIGFAIARRRVVRDVLGFPLLLISPVPVVAWMPITIMLFGTGEAFKIGLGTLACFLIVTSHTVAAATAIDRRYLEIATMYRKGELATIWAVLIPACRRHILTGVRIALAFAWVVVFFVEYATSEPGAEGLGWFIADARNLGRIEEEYAGVLMLALAGGLTDWIVAAYQERSTRWLRAAEAI